MTKPLYYDSAYLVEWQTTIQQIVEREDGVYAVLQETAFYPAGGGQPCDTGSINGIRVLDVIQEEDIIWHKLECLPEQKQATCSLDWDRRFDHMQQHSGQHLLSAVCLSLFGAKTLSFHLGVDYATIDVDLAELSPDKLLSLEQEVNRHIYLNHPITSYFVTAEEAAKLPLVKQPKVTEGIRIVEMKDVEYNACGGTHVAATGELGILKLLKAEKQKGVLRIYFLCGSRALREFQDNQRILNTLALKFNTGKEEILSRFEKWEQEHKQLAAELSTLKEQNDSFILRELLAASQASGSANHLIAHVFPDRNLKDLQTLAVKLNAEAALPVLLASKGESKVVLAAGGDKPVCGAFFKEHLGKFGGKGGGSDKMAQAAFGSWEEAASFFEFAKEQLSKE